MGMISFNIGTTQIQSSSFTEFQNNLHLGYLLMLFYIYHFLIQVCSTFVLWSVSTALFSSTGDNAPGSSLTDEMQSSCTAITQNTTDEGQKLSVLLVTLLPQDVPMYLPQGVPTHVRVSSQLSFKV